jgi:hypothetical protein
MKKLPPPFSRPTITKAEYPPSFIMLSADCW